MTLRLRLASVLLWFSTLAGAISFSFSIYFGKDVLKAWLRDSEEERQPLGPEANPADLIARGVESSVDLLGAIGEGIAEGLFLLSLCVLAVAVSLYMLGRKLRRTI